MELVARVLFWVAAGDLVYGWLAIKLLNLFSKTTYKHDIAAVATSASMFLGAAVAYYLSR